MTSGLQRRLLVLLLAPLLLLASLNTWFDLRSADSASLQQDSSLRSLIPLLSDSLVFRSNAASDPPVLLMAPSVEEFLSSRAANAAFAVVNGEGRVLFGDPWLNALPPDTFEMDFSSEEHAGITFRIVSQRVKTPAGDMAVRLADGSDPRQQWLRLLWVKAIFPNMVLVIAAFFAVNWAVRRALKPLLDLKDAVEHRSPHDLTALDPGASPDEVRPLVLSLNRLFDLVNAQTENQRRFVADAAHQLRTPLAALQSQIEAWAMALEAPAGQAPSAITLEADQILRLRHAVRRTSQLANQLLALSRADARTVESQPLQRVNIQTLCEAMLEAHLDAAAQKSIDLGLDAVPVHVFGHEWLLREMLGNLLDNAIRYTPPGGHVTLRCGRRPHPKSGHLAVFVEVEDDGPGVPVADRERVLERFYRVTGTQGEGNGLGLAIAAEIARVHQSQLQLSDGYQGRGLRVSMSFLE
ncbi:MAG: sensor histidine kinase N-terminal domain-containing protein [Rhodoferax sp.]|nr:sensor histidine kinase N-terminal domain-containing protein [Rhodoferax sp.]